MSQSRFLHHFPPKASTSNRPPQLIVNISSSMEAPSNYYPPPPYDSSQLIQQPDPAPASAPMMEKGQLPQQQAYATPQVQHQQAERNLVRDLITLIICFLIPPIAIALQNGPRMKLHILLSVLLCILGWLPAVLHARRHSSTQQTSLLHACPPPPAAEVRKAHSRDASYSCKFKLEMKIDAVDVKYSALFKMPTETEQISENSSEIIVDETYKLELEAMVKFKMMRKQFKPSAEYNCEMWKFWRGLVNMNVELSLPTSDSNILGSYNLKTNNEIKCTEFAEMLEKMSKNTVSNSFDENLDHFPRVVREYVESCRLAHFCAIAILLKSSSTYSNDDVLLANDKASNHLWKFTEFFNPEKLKNETKFTYNLRMLGMKCREHGKCQQIIQYC
uniref:Polynucleotide adenylyltransferase n=1 Tax=Globodera rostochiensis TaxID=31243 RepID=A0A914I2S6_GLORO